MMVWPYLATFFKPDCHNESLVYSTLFVTVMLKELL